MRFIAVDRVHRDNLQRLAPGNVASVGDVVVSTRLKQSAPDLPMRVLEEDSGNNMPKFGSMTDQVGRLIDSNWGGRRDFKTAVGFVIQDIRPADMNVEPFVGSMGDYSWRNKIATVHELKPRGEYFLPLPGPYIPIPGELPRGGNVPSITDIIDDQTPEISTAGRPSSSSWRQSNKANFDRVNRQSQKQSAY